MGNFGEALRGFGSPAVGQSLRTALTFMQNERRLDREDRRLKVADDRAKIHDAQNYKTFELQTEKLERENRLAKEKEAKLNFKHDSMHLISKVPDAMDENGKLTALGETLQALGKGSADENGQISERDRLELMKSFKDPFSAQRISAAMVTTYDNKYKRIEKAILEEKQKVAGGGAPSKKIPELMKQLEAANIQRQTARGSNTGLQAYLKGEASRKAAGGDKHSPQDIANLQNISPSELYMEHGYRVNDNGSLYLNPTTKQPVVLPRADKVLGKRGNMKSIMTLGEAWDDAKELTTLLAEPQVIEDLQSAKKANLWDRTKGMFSNKVQLWMQENGIAEDSKTAEAVARIQYMASEKRKSYMGTAVTETEMKSATAWMPQAGDALETIMTKTRLMAHEAEETFTRWLDTWKNTAQMGPYYKAFGIDRFGAKPTKDDWTVTKDADGNFKVGTGQGG